MKRVTIDFLAGIFVIIGVACIGFLAVKIAMRQDLFNKNATYEIYANFGNIGSLKVDAPVKISGFIIGRVDNIELDKNKVKVTMKINEKYKLSKDVSAQILTTGLLGEQYIGLQNGADDQYLQNGDAILLTSSALVLENLINKFMTNMGSK